MEHWREIQKTHLYFKNTGYLATYFGINDLSRIVVGYLDRKIGYMQKILYTSGGKVYCVCTHSVCICALITHERNDVCLVVIVCIKRVVSQPGKKCRLCESYVLVCTYAATVAVPALLGCQRLEKHYGKN